jgi:hypothetical protein
MRPVGRLVCVDIGQAMVLRPVVYGFVGENAGRAGPMLYYWKKRKGKEMKH